MVKKVECRVISTKSPGRKPSKTKQVNMSGKSPEADPRRSSESKDTYGPYRSSGCVQFGIMLDCAA